MKLAMDIHGVPSISILTQQQFTPVTFNQWEMYLQVYPGNVEKNRCKLLVCKQTLIKAVDKQLYILSAV